MDDIFLDLESPSLNNILDCRFKDQVGVGDGDNAEILAIECNQSYNTFLAHVELDVDETLGEDYRITRKKENDKKSKREYKIERDQNSTRKRIYK